MIFKSSMPWITLLPFFVVLICCNSHRKEETPSIIQTIINQEKRFSDSLNYWNGALQNLDKNTSDFGAKATLLNRKMDSLLKTIKYPSFFEKVLDSLSNWNHFSVMIQSTKKEFTVIQWDSRMGGSMPVYRTLGFLRNESEVKLYQLEDGNTQYDSIFILEDVHKNTIYLLHGTKKSAAYDFYDNLAAFSIKNDSFFSKSIFPQEKVKWERSFSLEELNTGSAPIFRISENGLKIQEPIPQENGLVWKPYVFDGNSFIPELYQLNIVVTKSDLVENQSANHVFLNGSELPVSTSVSQDVDLFEFEDKLIIADWYNEEQESTEIEISDSEAEPVQKTWFQFKNNINFIGRQGNYLFFSGPGLPERWPLHIYAIQQKKIILTKYVSEAMLQSGLLIFSESTHFEKTLQTAWPSCEGEQESRFQIKVLHFSEKLPTLQSTSQSYCDYLQ